MSSRSISVVAYRRVLFLFKANDILLYAHATFCLSIHLSVDTWVASMYQLLRIKLLSTWVCKSLSSFVSLGISRSGMLGHVVILLLIILGTSILLSIAVVQFYIPTNSAQGLKFLSILANTYFFTFYLNSS